MADDQIMDGLDGAGVPPGWSPQGIMAGSRAGEADIFRNGVYTNHN